MAERVREIDNDEGRRLLRILRRGNGSVVTWRRAQMVLLSAQGMPVAKTYQPSDPKVLPVLLDSDVQGAPAAGCVG